jgi:hypothetical protein
MVQADAVQHDYLQERNSTVCDLDNPCSLQQPINNLCPLQALNLKMQFPFSTGKNEQEKIQGHHYIGADIALAYCWGSVESLGRIG